MWTEIADIVVFGNKLLKFLQGVLSTFPKKSAKTLVPLGFCQTLYHCDIHTLLVSLRL